MTQPVVTHINAARVPQFGPLFGGVLVLVSVPNSKVTDSTREIRSNLGLGPCREDLLHEVTKASLAAQLDLSLFTIKAKLRGKVTPRVPFAIGLSVVSEDYVAEDFFNVIVPPERQHFNVEELDLGDMGLGEGVTLRVGMACPTGECRQALDIDADVRADLTTVYKGAPWLAFITEDDEEKAAAAMAHYLREVGTMAAHFLASEIQGIEERAAPFCDYMLRHDCVPTIPTTAEDTGIGTMVHCPAPGLTFETYTDYESTPAVRTGIVYRTKCGGCEEDHFVGIVGVMLTRGPNHVLDYVKESFDFPDPVQDLVKSTDARPPVIFQVPENVNIAGWLLQHSWVPALLPKARAQDKHMEKGFLQTVAGTRHLA